MPLANNPIRFAPFTLITFLFSYHCFAQQLCESSEDITRLLQNNPTMNTLDQTINLALKGKQAEYCNWVKARDNKIINHKFDKIGFTEFHLKCEAVKSISDWHIDKINHLLTNCKTDACINAKINLENLNAVSLYQGKYVLKEPGVSIQLDKANKDDPIKMITFNRNHFDGDCGSMGIQLLFVGNYPDDKNTSINKSIDSSLAKEYLDIKYAPLKSNQLAEKLFLDHEYNHSYSEVPQFEDQQYFSYSQLFSHYTGGAHGNHSITHININKKTGEILKLSDLLDLKYKDQILAIAKNNLYSYYELDTSKALNEHGFWFAKGEAPKEAGVWVDKDGFYLPDNFLLQPDGLIFTYQPYEVAPYAMGMPQTEILWNELDDIGQ